MDALAILQRLGGGHFIQALAEALTEVSEDVVAKHTPGRVSVTLSISPAPGDIAVTIEEAISRTMPKEKPLGAYLFAVAGELHGSDPRQPTMEFRQIDTHTGEIREVDYGIPVVKEMME